MKIPAAGSKQGDCPSIFVIINTYLPGYKAGGPLRTVANMVQRMKGFKFLIFTRDRDAQDDKPYVGVPVDQWNRLGDSEVFYSADMSFRSISEQIANMQPSVIYLNSFFSPLTIKVLLLRAAGRLPRIPVVIAPRGELSPGALQLKSRKKRAFLASVYPLLYRGLIWQASSPLEKSEIEQVLGSKLDIRVASDLPPLYRDLAPARKPSKEPGRAKFVYLSRITEKKNLLFLLSLLSRLRGAIELDIWGPIADSQYFDRCEAAAAELPDSVTIAWRGHAAHERVTEILQDYHFFVLPTLGENFGHVIPESWAAGCPVVISDRTPWAKLEAIPAGWDLPLEDVSRWQGVLQHCLDMDQDAYTAISNSSRRYLIEWSSRPDLDRDNEALFRYALDADSAGAQYAVAN